MEPQDFIDMLPRDVVEKFKYNLQVRVEDVPRVSFDTYVKMRDPDDVIMGAFTWKDTPEGHTYWRDIQSMLENGAAFPDPEDYSVEDMMPYFKASEWAQLTKKAFKVHGFDKYNQLIAARYKTLGLFIITMLGLENWRGVPHKYNDVTNRRHLKRPPSGQFYHKQTAATV